MNACCNSRTVAFSEIDCHAAGRVSETLTRPCVTHSWCRSEQSLGAKKEKTDEKPWRKCVRPATACPGDHFHVVPISEKT